MDLHGSFETETVTATVKPPVLEQQDINVEAHGKRLSIFGDFKRSENHDKSADIRYRNARIVGSLLDTAIASSRAEDVHTKMENC